MFANVFPNFGKGRILKKEMLENLRDFPRAFLDSYYSGFSSGVISGAHAVIGDNCIKICNGILKFNDIIYLLESAVSVPYYPTNKEVLLKIRFLEPVVEGDFKSHCTNVFIDENTNIEKDELELGRFKLREGAVLRSQYRDFYDFSTEYNTINVINVEYAAHNLSTINPLILKYFSRVVMKCGSENPYDINFSMLCLTQETIERELITYYIACRLGIDFKDYSNMEIYKYLTMILREVESGIKKKIEFRQNKPSRIIVD